MKISLITLALLLPWSLTAQTNEEVSFGTDSVLLSGTLTLPTGQGPFPAVVLVSGSGPQDRDSQILGFKPFKILADSLAEVGIAVLRYDDRGTGKSNGKSVNQSTSEELASDAYYAVQLLKKHRRIQAGNIGVIGHSEGGIIAPMVAVQDPDVAFIVLMAGYGVKGVELSNAQAAAIMKASGMSEDYIEKANELNGKILQMMSQPDVTDDELEQFVVEETVAMVDLMPDTYKKSITDPEAYAKQQAKSALAQFKSPWIKYYMSYDPAPTLAEVKCPVLMLFAALDTQVLVSQNQMVMESILSQAGNENVTTKVFEKANHLFQEAKTGAPQEYAFLKKEFDPEFLPYLQQWLLATLR
ncbi:MAG: alpha/beta fold hydrolase [Bacteroidota bacterium]